MPTRRNKHTFRTVPVIFNSGIHIVIIVKPSRLIDYLYATLLIFNVQIITNITDAMCKARYYAFINYTYSINSVV